MSNLNNAHIDKHVRTIAAAYLQGVKTRPQDEPVIRAGVELLINFLQNINSIADCTGK